MPKKSIDENMHGSCGKILIIYARDGNDAVEPYEAARGTVCIAVLQPCGHEFICRKEASNPLSAMRCLFHVDQAEPGICLSG